jgi:hypothetical protein
VAAAIHDGIAAQPPGRVLRPVAAAEDALARTPISNIAHTQAASATAALLSSCKRIVSSPSHRCCGPRGHHRRPNDGGAQWTNGAQNDAGLNF